MESNKNLNVTIVDVAKKCGLSIATVSRVLHNPSLVRPRTRERVKAIIAETGYVYNSNAGNFARKSSNLIGLITSTTTDTTFSTIASELQTLPLQKNYDIFIANSFSSAVAEDRLLVRFMERRVTAVVMIGYCSEIKKTFFKLHTHNIPTLILWSKVEDPTISNICIDGRQTGYMATRYLMQLGHQHIGFILGNYKSFQPAKERFQGYCDAYTEAGLTVNPAWVAAIDQPNLQSGNTAAIKLLQSADRPTAIIAADDTIAVGAMFAARNLGLRIPEDVSIIGMNDDPFAQQMSPPLTSINIPYSKMAQLATTYLTELIESKEPLKPIRVELPLSLIVRDSCGPVPRNG